MGYQSDKKQHGHDTNKPGDWIQFPDEAKEEVNPYADFTYWDDEQNKQADDLLHVSRLEGLTRQRIRDCVEEIDHRERVRTYKPLPLWARLLLHQPTNNIQSALYVIGFGSLLIASIVLFVNAVKMIG